MKRTWLLVIPAVVAALIALWLVKRDRGGAPPTAAPTAATAKPTTGGTSDGATPRGGDAELVVLEDDDPVGKLRLEGQVIDAAAEPVSGAIVTVSSRPPRVATSEADGSFAVDGLLGREYTLVARATAGVAGPITARLTASSEPVVLRLVPAAAAEVTVVAAEGKAPVAGATVELRGLDSLSATTDGAGLARVAPLVADEYEVVAEAAGFARQSAAVRVAPGATARVELALRRGAAVAGRVVDPAGQPVAGARVVWSGASEWSQQGDRRRDGVTTGADGGFRFAALPAGSFRFFATADQLAPGSSTIVTLDGQSRKDGVEIRLAEGARLHGTVTDRQGAGVAGARVRVGRQLRSLDFSEARQAVTDDAGHFEMTGLGRAAHDVVALGERATSQVAEVDLAKVAERELALVLDVDGHIAGVVVDPAGQPVEGAQVSAWPDLGRGGPGGPRRPPGMRLRGSPTELSDAGGRFDIGGLEPGSYTVRATPAGVGGQASAWLREGVTAETGATDLRIVLPRDGGVTGKVAFASGEAPELFTVSVGMRGQPFSGKDGTFELGDLPARTLELTVRGPGFDTKVVPAIVVKEGETTDVGTITVARGRTISGRVIDAGGQPVAGALIRAGKLVFGDGSTSKASFGGPPQARNTKETTADDGGEFTIYGVGRGDLSIVAESDAGRSPSLLVTGSDQPVVGLTLQLSGFGALEGTVTKAGAPVPSMIVTASALGTPGVVYSVQGGDDGRFRFDRLAPDTYKVSAMVTRGMMSGMGFHPQTAVVASDQTATVALTIEGGDVALVIAPAPKGGGELGFAMVALVQGKIQAATARELTQVVGRLTAYSSQAFSIRGRPARVEELRAGGYTACVTPVPSEVRGMPDTMAYLEREGDNLPVFCKAVTVAAQPAEQTVTVEVTAPTFVPPPPEG